jgi:hypothetical protein
VARRRGRAVQVDLEPGRWTVTMVALFVHSWPIWARPGSSPWVD